MNFNTLKKIVPITAVLHDKGLLKTFRRQGERLVGPCPVHGGDNPNAFVVNLKKNLWYCFTGCNSGGDIIDLVCRLEGKNFRQTLHYLTSLAGCPHGRFSFSPPASKLFKPFSQRLPLNHFTAWLPAKKITPRTAALFEAGAYQGKGFLADSIGVRLHDLRGTPIGYAARRLNPETIKRYGKWQFPPRFPKNTLLYNYHRLARPIPNCLFITECPWSVMRLQQINIPAVALMGIQLSQAQCMLLGNVNDIVLMLDGDYAGVKATRQIEWKLKKNVRGMVHSIILPDGLDPDDLTDDELREKTGSFFSNQPL